MAQAAADATGCTVELSVDPMNRCRTMLNSPTLLGLWRGHLAAAGIADDPIDPNVGSTDMANVSHEVPTIHPYLAIGPRGMPGSLARVRRARGRGRGRPRASRSRSSSWPRRRSTSSASLHLVGRSVGGAARHGRRTVPGAARAERHLRRPGRRRGRPGRDLRPRARRDHRGPRLLSRAGAPHGRCGDRPRLRVGPSVRTSARDERPQHRRGRRLGGAPGPRGRSHRRRRSARVPLATRAGSSSSSATCEPFVAAIASGWPSWPACWRTSTVPRTRLRALDAARSLLEPDGVLIVDNLGPGALPPHDLPLSVDWERELGDRRVVRRSSLRAPRDARRAARGVLDPHGPRRGRWYDSRLPAGFRLWYPSVHALIGLADEARAGGRSDVRVP